MFASIGKKLLGQKRESPSAAIDVSSVVGMLRKKTVCVALLGAISVAGLGMRGYRLGKWGFWRDEMFSVGDQEDGFNYTPLRQSASQYLIRQVVRRRGVNEWNARLVPALIGVASIPILYPVLSRTYTQPVALLVSALLAISPWHLYWSQNARFYTLLHLLYSLALFTFYLGLEEDRPSLLLASLLFLGLSVRERLLALFFVPVAAFYLGVLLLADYPKPRGLHWRNLALYFLPGGVGAFLFARPYLRNLSGWMEGFGRSNNSPLWLAGSVSYYLSLPVVLLASGSAIYGFIVKDRSLLFTSSGAFLPPAILMLIAPFHYTANRYGFITLSSWLALASYGVITLAGRLLQNERRTAAAGLISLPLLQYLIDDIQYFSHNGNRDRWKEAFTFLHSRIQDDDLVFSTDPVLADHYLQRQTRHLEELENIELPIRDARAWFVEDLITEQSFPKISDWLTKHARQIASFDEVIWLRTFKMRIYLTDA